MHGARLLTDAGVTPATHDVAANPTACDTVIALGRRSLSVLVAPDGTSTTGAAAGELTRNLNQHHPQPSLRSDPVTPVLGRHFCAGPAFSRASTTPRASLGSPV
ncbi:MAG: hypothetical protein M0Z93_00290 [Actinomycetota bacterium]|nr:hypothetical protein [Actinomycetota bacterium]